MLVAWAVVIFANIKVHDLRGKRAGERQKVGDAPLPTQKVECEAANAPLIYPLKR